MPEIRMCDLTDAAGTPCKEPAALAYRWDWGQSGVCCQACSLLLVQAAQNLSSHDLKRHVSLAPLEHAAEAPLERSERTQLIAAKLSAEEETAELKARGGELYRNNVELTRQVQSITLRHREADTQLREAQRKIEQLETKLKDRDVELATVTDELQRLQTLAAFAPETVTGTGGKGAAPAKGKGG